MSAAPAAAAEPVAADRTRIATTRASEAERPDGALRFLRAMALIGVIAAAVAFAVLRLYTVPIFAPSDEDDHFDYAISIARAGHLLSAKNALGFPTADLESAFLQTYADRPRVYLNPGERAPSGPPAYGSPQYFRRIDHRSSTELPDPHAAMNAPDHPNPVLVSMYPFGYYGADALWIGAAWSLTHSLSASFFAARWFSVALLAGSLALSYGVLRELRWGRPLALAMTAVVGCFGLTTFTHAYVQPDDLALFATSACFLSALRLRRPRAPLEWAGFALALGVLAVTKYQTALCVALPAVAATSFFAWRRRRSAARFAAAAALCALPAAATLFVQAVVIGKNDAFQASLASHFVQPQRVPGLLLDAIRYYFIGNVTPPLTHDYRYAAALSYWNDFGNLDTDVTLVDPAVDRVARTAIAALTALVGLLAVVRTGELAVRLARVATARRFRRLGAAIEIALADVPLNAYALFAVFMVVFYALTDNNWRQSGRNWIPFVLPALALGVRYAPQVLPGRRLRRAFAGALLALLALYSTVGSYDAAAATQARYFGPADLPPLARLARGPQTDILIGHVGSAEVDVRPQAVVPMARGASIEIEGLAADAAAHDRAAGVWAIVDGRDHYAASYQYSHQDYAQLLGNPKLFWAGFHVTIPTDELAFGPHRITFAIVSRDRAHWFPTPRTVNVEVAGGGPDRPAPIGDRELVGSLNKVAALDQAAVDGAEHAPVALGADRSLYVAGWLVDLRSREPVRRITLAVDGGRPQDVHVGDLHPELRTAFPQLPPMVAARAGFATVVPLDRLGRGAHRFSLVATDAAGRTRPLVRDFPIDVLPKAPPNVVVPAPAALPATFGDRDGAYVGSVDFIAPLAAQAAWNPVVSPAWISRGEPAVVQGWAVDVRHRRPLGSIDVAVDGGAARAATTGDSRPDVALGLAPMPVAATAQSGFDRVIQTAPLALGLHTVTVTAADPRGGRRITLLRNAPFTVY